MKRILTLVALVVCSVTALLATEAPLWLRYPSISPDGKTIAFTYEGDIYTVETSGGRATQLTSHSAIDYQPIWSRDGQTIAFASNRTGNFDVYTVAKEGGKPTRLTYWSGNDVPMCFSPSGDEIYIKSHILQAQNYPQSPAARLTEVYVIDAHKASNPRQLTSVCMERANLSADGKSIIYQDKKGYEDNWRKHHTSSITRNIWKYDIATGLHTQITTFKGEDRDPVFDPEDPTRFYYVNEQQGSLNVYSAKLDGSDAKAITHHSVHPVRFLSVANNGIMAYSYNGELYHVKGNAAPRKVNVKIYNDKLEADSKIAFFKSGMNEMAVAPSGKEIAFIVRGDVYVTSADYATTVRITNTPEQERSVSYSPDGRSLVYASERDGLWRVYTSSLTEKHDKQFCYAIDWEEECMTPENTVACFQPRFSPDGKEIAFLEDRTTVKVLKVGSKKQRVVVPGIFNYSYADGDQWYAWSPDGKYIVANYFEKGGWNSPDVGLFEAEGNGKHINLTQSGYGCQGAGFVLGGKALLFSSDKLGYRSHGSWGSMGDYYLMFFDQEAYDSFLRSKEDAERLKMTMTPKEEKKEAKEEKKEEKAEAKGKLPKLEYDFKNCMDRVVRLTPSSAHYGAAFLNKSGSKLYYMAHHGQGYNLWVTDFKEHSTRMLIELKSQGADLQSSADLSKLFMLSSTGISSVNLGRGSVKPIEVDGEFTYRASKEREYIFNHAVQQVEAKFYDPTIRNMNWKRYGEMYARFLPYINNNFDFAEMMSELLGELNGSHTGMRSYNFADGDRTAVLGVFFDPSYKGDGLRVLEVMEGNTIISADSNIKPGAVIKEIDGHKIKAGEDYFRFLNKMSGRAIHVKVAPKGNGKGIDEVLRPMSQGTQQNLLYKRWVKRREAIVDSVSGGSIAYVHVRGMDSPSFRDVYSNLLGKYRNRDAVVVDTRFNGGGWLHDDLATLLMGKRYVDFVPRGQYVASEPFNKWTKPSCLLVSEGNYSDAHGFAYTYQTLQIGKIVGMPVPGTMTAVWWERQIDPSLVFGIPQVGMKDLNGNYIENQELEPDVLVNNDPNSMQQGRDLQLEAATKLLMKK